MARPLRIEYEGGTYHITARGNEKRVIFDDETDFRKFESFLNRYIERFGVRLYCYVLMDNHYHLLIETPRANLTAFMHNVQSYYTNYYNRRHNRVGRLFQGRYKALIVDKDSYLLDLSRYIHLNPVRAGLVKRPEQWRWSSYTEYIKPSSVNKWIETGEILSHFGKRRNTACRKYAEFTRAKLGKDDDDIFSDVASQLILGSDEFVEKVKSLISGGKAAIGSEIVAGRELAGWTKRDGEKAVEIISGMFGVKKNELLDKGGYKNGPRDTAIAIFHRYSRWRNNEIGEMFGISGNAVNKKVGQYKTGTKKGRELGQMTAHFLTIFPA